VSKGKGHPTSDPTQKPDQTLNRKGVKTVLWVEAILFGQFKKEISNNTDLRDAAAGQLINNRRKGVSDLEYFSHI
jgi:hypothetical protein